MGDFFISADELNDLKIRGVPHRVFDVRRRQAILPDSRFLPGSRWRNHVEADQWGPGAATDGLLVVNCMHGHNVSQIAGTRLREAGVMARVLTGGVDGWVAQDLPTVGQSQMASMGSDAPTVWVTRLGAKIDRVACPWLIRRFIDPEAQFHFVEKEWVLDVAEEIGGIAFDIQGAQIEDDGDLCSFDRLMREFDIRDAALDKLAVIVRGADTERNDLAPETAGLLAVSIGNAARARNDQETLLFGLPVYDALYARLRLAADEVHGWRPMAP